MQTLESLVRTVDAVHAGRSSARVECEQALARIEAGRDLKAIVAVDAALSLREADMADRRLEAGEILPLAGAALAVKDLIWVDGRRVTQGSRLFADFVAPQDALAVSRLKQAGAVVVGMANSSEFGCKGVTANPLHGATRHPLDPALTPGGSSGGCASAVAGGLVAAAIGTDSGGSSRRPAAHVGCVGFKPSTGAVPNGPGFPALDIGLECLCPMAGSVADIRLLFEAMADRPASSGKEASTARRLGFTPSFGLDVPVDLEIEALLEAALAALRQAGFSVERRDPAWPDGAEPADLMPLQYAMLADLYGDAFEQDPDLFDPDIAVQIEAGLRLEARAVSRALRLSKAIRLSLDATLDGVDALLSPTVPCFAWPSTELGPSHIAGRAVGPRAHAAFTPFINHGGHPALSLPIGVGAVGLPAGLQICGKRNGDDDLLALAARIEASLCPSGRGGTLTH
ncbi:MAG: amidase [Aurantimonas endophytica]|uniref:Aspartyl-tRNA(Asn)/glutamyl-tRNA(Gln) amidotransferase subunit A n=1 Tax=Aurantimonas endophytica TaxID=1522175 RepID=A0A7W6HBI9_9HYPH|nr:amidase [Aurantimonas endophytica]MBB4002041.1 aspartyl-tRNA(Asn)/glutamyl-tRNA(Gln) amidotransferase subunit A [Aurantimonas endophytica]MCO6402326.1 amidase [Aurantimonas endophytica]